MSEKKSKDNALCWLFLFRILVLFAPFGSVLVLKRACFFSFSGEAIAFSAAGMICAVLLLMLIFSVPRSSQMTFTFGAIFVISTLLSSFLDGAALASGVAFLCKMVDKIILLPLCERAREKALVQKTAQAAAAQVQEMLKSHAGRV